MTICWWLCRFCADVPLVASDRVELVKDNDKHTITIKKVVKAEEGIINVKATNEVGQMSASARLKVTGIHRIRNLFVKYMLSVSVLIYYQRQVCLKL